MIPVEACYLGWQESLTQLAELVEPQIPDGALAGRGNERHQGLGRRSRLN